MSETVKKIKWQRIGRGLRGVCPNCGDAKLFKSYLKQVDTCGACGQNWGSVRADDGPAWASMLITGHVLAPFFYFIIFKTDLPDWASTSLLVALGVGICLAILPAMKGLFIALIWHTDAPTS